MIRKFLIGLACAAGVTAQAEKTLVYCSEASPKIFNPQLAADGPTLNASAQMIYNRLADFKPGTTEIAPSLAESWAVSKDGKTYTFRLRKNVKFHPRGDFKPTRAMTSEDVVFTFMRMHDANHPFHKVSGGTYEYYKSMGLDKLIKTVRAVDPLTVRFELNQPDSPFIANLGMNFASILSAEYADFLAKKKTPEKIDLEPVGTGPFVLKNYSKDTNIRYEAFTDYFEGKAKLDKVVFAITPDANVRFQRLKAGECQLVAEPSPQDLKNMQKLDSVQVVSGPGLNVGYLALNVQKPPLDKRDVRLAVHHALNRAAYIDAIYMGQAQIAKNPLPPTIWGYNTKTVDIDYNPEKAKELLKKAGFEKGLDLELWTLPVSRPYNPNGKKMGEMMQADLAKVGIRVKLVTYEWSTYLDKAAKGEHQLIQLGWTGDNGDPDNFMNVLLGCDAVAGGSNYARWCHKPFDELVQKARRETKQSARVKLYEEAQKIFKEEAPWVPIAHSTVFRALDKRLVGYKLNPLGTEDFYILDIR
jgi:dipeptide transport system substrate-binding protein